MSGSSIADLFGSIWLLLAHNINILMHLTGYVYRQKTQNVIQWVE